MKQHKVWHLMTLQGDKLEELIKTDSFFKRGQAVEVFQIVDDVLRIVYKNPRLPQFNIPVFDIQERTYEGFCKVNYKGRIWSLSCYFRELSATCIG